MVSGLPDYHRYIVPSPVVVDAKVGSAFVAEYDSTPEDLADGAKGPLLVDIKGRLYVVQFEKDREVDHVKVKGVALTDPTVAASVPISIENPAIAYDAVNDRFKVDIKALTANEVDISDDWTRQLGLIDLSRVLGAALAHTNPVICRISDGSAFINAAKEDGNLASILAKLDVALSTRALEAGGNLATIAGKDFATQTTLAALNTKIPSDPAKESGKLTEIDTVLDNIYTRLDIALSTLRDAITAASPNNKTLKDLHDELVAIKGYVDGIETTLTSIDGKDFATQTTLAALNTKIPSDPSKESGKLTEIDTVLDNIYARVDIALSTLRDAITAASPNNKTLKDLHDELVTIKGHVDGIEGYVDGLETLLAGGLPAALDAGALKVKEQSPLSEIDVDIAKVLNSALAHTNPVIVRISDGSAFFDPLKQGEYVVARGSQAQALVQEATNYRLAVQPYGSQGQHLQQKATTYELLTDPVDRAARLLGVVYGSAGQKLAQEVASPYELQISINQDNVGLALETGGNLATIAGDTTSIDGKIPSDPAKESGKLTDIATDLAAIEVLLAEPADRNITQWAGTALTGRDISGDLQALIDDSIKGLMRSLGDAGATPTNATGETLLKKLDTIKTKIDDLEDALGSVATDFLLQTPKYANSVFTYRGGNLAPQTSEDVVNISGDGILEALAFSSNEDEWTNINVIIEGDSLRVPDRDGDASSVDIAQITMNYLAGESALFKQPLYDTTNNYYVFYLKKPIRYNTSLRIVVKNDHATATYKACVTVIYTPYA